MTKKILTLAIALVAGFSLSIAQADDEKGKGKPDRKGDRKKVEPAKRAEMIIKKLDKDDDGKLSKEEFAAGPIAKRIIKEKGQEAADKMFGMRDENKDGFLDKKELSKPPKRGKGKPGKGKGKPDGKKKEDKKKEGDS